MKSTVSLSKQWVVVSAVAGIIANLLFPILLFVSLPAYLEILFVAFFGICFSLCGFGIHHCLKHERPSVYSQIAALFVFVSGFLFNLMLVVQLTFKGYLDFFNSQATTSSEKDVLGLIAKTVDPIQLAMQISNDFFIATAMILFAIVMYRHSNFGKLWSIIGGVVAVMLIIVKCYAFPFTPEEVGIPYVLGPLISIWFLAVCIQCLRLVKIYG